MTFFARPNLSDEQFKQLQGTTLTLSGQTKIATITGLTLANNSIGTSYPNIVITAEDADTHVGHVLTYDGYGKICLRSPSGVGGDPVYNPPYKSPAAITLGGINAGDILTGCTLACIIQELLVPTLNPTLTPPSNTLSISPPTTTYEVGSQPSLSLSATFFRGSVSPVYAGGPSTRTGVASAFNYIAFGASCPPQPTGAAYLLSAYSILQGNNNISGTVSYLAGNYAKDSTGADWIAGGCCTNGVTGAQSITLTGLYPWFWGKSSTLPVAGQALLNSYTTGGGKCVASSAGAITVTNHNASDEYIWFAIPSASASRSAWQGANNPSNNGVIPGALFPAVATVSVNSPESCWSGISYKFYISGYKTSVNYGMTYS